LSQSSSTDTNTNEQGGLDDYALAVLASHEDVLGEEDLAAFIEQQMQSTAEDTDLENLNSDFLAAEERVIELIMVCARPTPLRVSASVQTTVTL